MMNLGIRLSIVHAVNDKPRHHSTMGQENSTIGMLKKSIHRFPWGFFNDPSMDCISRVFFNTLPYGS
jgi:hypothetical protein